MNFRSRYLVITIRTLLGLMFVFSGVTGLIAGNNMMQGVPEAMIPTSQALWGMGIFQMIKTTEIVAGFMLVVGFLPALGLLFLAPICIGVLVYNSRVAPAYLASGIIVTIFTLYLGYAYWARYKTLFERS